MSRQPRINEYIKVKGIPELADKEVKVVASALGSVWVKPYKRAREDIEVSLNQVEFIEPEKLETKEKYEIIEKLVKPELLEQDKTRYKIELAILNRLYEKFPNIDFWKSFDPGYQAKSIIWWQGGGKDDLRKAFNEFALDTNRGKPQNRVELTSEKIGEDVQINNTKPKNLFDL